MFDWSQNFRLDRWIDVYRMTVADNHVIQGALAIEKKEDRVFQLVGPYLFAFACKSK